MGNLNITSTTENLHFPNTVRTAGRGRRRILTVIVIEFIRRVILYPHMHHGKRKHQPGQEQSPSRIKYIQIPETITKSQTGGKKPKEEGFHANHLRDASPICSPNPSSTSRLHGFICPSFENQSIFAKGTWGLQNPVKWANL